MTISEENKDISFSSWLDSIEIRKKASEIRDSFSIINAFCLKKRIIRKPLQQIIDLQEIRSIKQIIIDNRQLKIHSKKQLRSYVKAIFSYEKYLESLQKPNGENDAEGDSSTLPTNKEELPCIEQSDDDYTIVDFNAVTSYALGKHSETTDEKLVRALEKFLREKKDGVRLNEIEAELAQYKCCKIRNALKSEFAVLVLDKYYHKDNITNLKDTADMLLEILKRQMGLNSGYTSAKKLYDDAHVRLDDFFFYNNAFESQREVYDIAKYLFEQVEYKGYHFIFRNSIHIWKSEPDYPKDFSGLFVKWARENGNSVTREMLLEKLEENGSDNPGMMYSYIMRGDGKQYFWQYDDEAFFLKEAIQIDDYFINELRNQLDALLESDYYVAMMDIDDYFYSTLPMLSGVVYWSPYLLEDILQEHDIGYLTIPSDSGRDIKAMDAVLVSRDSNIKTFGDVVWEEVNRAFELPKEFETEDLRQFLIGLRLLQGNDKKYSLHKCFTNDLRYFWREGNSKVTISKR